MEAEVAVTIVDEMTIKAATMIEAVVDTVEVAMIIKTMMIEEVVVADTTVIEMIITVIMMIEEVAAVDIIVDEVIIMIIVAVVEMITAWKHNMIRFLFRIYHEM